MEQCQWEWFNIKYTRNTHKHFKDRLLEIDIKGRRGIEK